MRRTLFILASGFVLTTIIAMIQACCPGSPFSDSYFKVDNFTPYLSTGVYREDLDIMIFGANNVIPIEGDSVAADYFAIKLSPEIRYVGLPITSSIFNSAYACSPPEPISLDTLTSISITSDSTVVTALQSYEAGEQLNEILAEEGHPEMNIDDALQNPWFLARDGIVLLFRELPSATTKMNFKILLRFTDGREFQLQTKSIVLTR